MCRIAVSCLGAALSLIAAACARTPDSGRSVPSGATPATTPATEPDAAPPGEQPKGTPWQERCAAWLEGALRVAAQKEPGLRGAWVERDPPVPTGDGREAVVIAVFPPVFPVPGLHVRVARTAGPPDGGESAHDWQRFAESFHGRYHATIIKRAGRLDAAFAFDGWDSARVDVLAPIFQAAADHCAEP